MTAADALQEAVARKHLEPAGAVLFISFALLIGMFTRHAMQAVPVPYTALLLIWGLLIGIADSTFAKWHHMSEALEVWEAMDPGLLLLVFLPVLIFSSAYSLDFHVFKRCFGQVLLLAGPGVVIGTAIIGAAMKYLFPYGWDWSKCLLFGAMMSATDPVAVVALLKEVGASQKLGTVIEGESLFNDGTAFVFFLLFKESVEGVSRSTASSVGFFAQLALGGPLLGILFAAAATTWLASVFNDPLVEISVTFVVAYMTFYVAEDLLHVSGVLGVVVLGIVMSATGSNRISAEVHVPLHVFWEMLEYFANTLIFVYSGVIIAVEVAAEDKDFLEARDWGYAVILYILLQVARVITILVLYPALTRMGYGTTFKEAAVMVWGGLRGAVGLALALIVKLDVHIDDKRFQALTVFFMGLMAAATLVINGASMPFLLDVLGVTRASPAKLEVLNHVIKEVEMYGENHLDHLKHDQLMGNPDWDRVIKLTELDVASIIPEQVPPAQRSSPSEEMAPAAGPVALKESRTRKFAKAMKDLVKTGLSYSSRGSRSSQTEVVTREMLLTDMRARLLQAAKASYGDGFDKGYIGVNAIVDLRESADKALDHLSHPLSDWDTLERLCKIPPWIRWMQSYAHVCKFQQLIQKLLFNSMEFSAVLATAFVFAHKQAQQGLREYIEVSADEVAQENCTAGRIGAGLDRMKYEVGEAVCDESQQQCAKAVKFVKSLTRGYPDIVRAIKTKQTSHTVLMHKRRFIDRLAKAGLIEQKEWRQLETLIKRALKKLIYTPPQLQLPGSKELIRAHALFSDVEDMFFESHIWPNVQSFIYDKGRPIFSVGEEATHVAMVTRGVVQVRMSDETREEGAGAIIGITEVLMDQKRVRSLVADTAVEVFLLHADIIRHLTEVHEGLELRGWQLAGIVLAMLHGPPEMAHLDYSDLYRVFRSATLEKVPIAHQVQITGGALLIQGSLEEIVLDSQEQTVIVGPVMLKADPAFYTCLTPVKLLSLPDNWYSNLKRPDVHAVMMRQTAKRDRITKQQSIGRGALGPTDTSKRLAVNTEGWAEAAPESPSALIGARSIAPYKSIARRGSIVFKPRVSLHTMSSVGELPQGAKSPLQKQYTRPSLIEMRRISDNNTLERTMRRTPSA